jgi:hypothetical protein
MFASDWDSPSVGKGKGKGEEESSVVGNGDRGNGEREWRCWGIEGVCKDAG